MTGPFRLPAGGRIDRDRPLAFSFDGRRLTGAHGDTLASALLANGIHLTGRSFKYHRPRGILGAGTEEPNALVKVRGTPNLPATQVPLYDGLAATSQNRSPSLTFDVGAIAGLAAPLLPAGFYYKTFMWPAAAWKTLYEPRIRAAAGLGQAPETADPDRYAQRFAHADVLVVGAGPAGLAAALAAVQTGARVILCDEQSEFGGSLLADTESTIDGVAPATWVAATLRSLAANPRVTLLPRTTAFGYFPHNMVGLSQALTDHMAIPDPAQPRQRLWQVRAKTVILATGAIERPLVFADNDRPGIMLADAARTYVTRYGVRPGTRAVIVTAHDAAYHAALTLHAAGITIVGIADLRETADGVLPQTARTAGIPVRLGTSIVGTKGRLRVSGVSLLKAGQREALSCDLVLMSGGFTPSVHQFSQSRGTLRFDAALAAFVPDVPAEATLCAGACHGTTSLQAALEDGATAGGSPRSHVVTAWDSAGPGFLGVVPNQAPQAKAFVDFQNDVTAKDLLLATREGFRSIEHIKRYTTTGMATDQGKTSNMNALGIVAEALARPIPQVGLTTFRMPYTPISFGVLAGASRGALFDPVRTTPIHDWAEAAGAVFEDVGNWKRARYFPHGTEDMHQAVGRECLAVRAGAGLFDASTLGKIEVVGPDAATFLNRMYVNDWTKLGVGRCKYGVMLREDGFVMDDGVIGRLAADRFHVTTTTGGAARVLAVMEDYRQTEWPDLDVWLTSITDQWAVIAVQGPRARDIIRPLVPQADLDTMPHMAVTETLIGGIPGRLFRVSFTGELGYELNVPADHGTAIWQAVLAEGAAHGITAYGTESMHVLRAEKGYIIVGQDTDGTATPGDVGLGWAVGGRKPDFVGKRSLARASMADPQRKQLVGLMTDDPAIVLEEGAQIVASEGQKIPMAMIGHVTSAYRSPTLGGSIALAMLKGGRALMGQTVYLPMPSGTIAAKVVGPVFHDPEGKRLNG